MALDLDELRKSIGLLGDEEYRPPKVAAKSKAAGRERDDYDWYIEPDWCVELLIQKVSFDGPIHDPACGSGTIPQVLKDHGWAATGSDIVDRGYGYRCTDFLAEEILYDNIVTNPPYRQAAAFVKRALQVCRGKVAMIVRLDFLAAQRRNRSLFTPYPPVLVIVLSRRPSMPPGWLPEVEAKGGQHDYCWIVWDRQEPFAQTRVAWAM